MRDREEEKEAKKEEAARQRRKKEEEEAVRRMTKEVEVSGCSHAQVCAQLEALEEVLQSLSAEDREVAKLKEVVEEQRLALDQPTVARRCCARWRSCQERRWRGTTTRCWRS